MINIIAILAASLVSCSPEMVSTNISGVWHVTGEQNVICEDGTSDILSMNGDVTLTQSGLNLFFEGFTPDCTIQFTGESNYNLMQNQGCTYENIVFGFEDAELTPDVNGQLYMTANVSINLPDQYTCYANITAELYHIAM